MMRNELQRLPYSKQHERQRILNKLIDSKQSSVHWMDKTVLGK